jgi:hypothetical protein
MSTLLYGIVVIFSLAGIFAALIALLTWLFYKSGTWK